MRVLFDKNMPYGARKFLSEHQIETVDERGWSTISNGELLKSAESAGFEVVITADQKHRVSTIPRRTKDCANRVGLKHLAYRPELQAAIAEHVNRATPGSYAFIEMAPPAKSPKRQSRA